MKTDPRAKNMASIERQNTRKEMVKVDWKFWKKKKQIQKVKKIRLTARDIQENCMRIKAAMDRTKIGTPEYEALAKELDFQLGLLKKIKDANQVISVKDALVIGGTTVSLVFFIALAREYPTALKVASMILKFIPFKGI